MDDKFITEILRIAYKAVPKNVSLDGNIVLESHEEIKKMLQNADESNESALSSKDIKSLGWKHSGGKMLSGALQEYTIGEFTLYYAENNQTFLSIDVKRTHQIFRGRINNKSSLQVLMKWLGIDLVFKTQSWRLPK